MVERRYPLELREADLTHVVYRNPLHGAQYNAREVCGRSALVEEERHIGRKADVDPHVVDGVKLG